VKGAAGTVEDIFLCPTSPPVGLVLEVVLNPIKDATVAIRALKVDFYAPARIIDGSYLGAELMLPVTVALSLVPVC